MIVDSALYRAGARLETDATRGDYAGLRAAATQPDDFVWVGLADPDEAELADVAGAFGLHGLAVEDAVVAHQRPKLEQYDGLSFMVLKTLRYVDAEDAVETGEVSLFIGDDYLVTVRHGHDAGIASARRRLESEREVLAGGTYAAVYAIADVIVDGYASVLAGLTVDVDEVEESVFSEERTSDSARIYRLKREVAEARRAVLPLLDTIRRYAAGDHSLAPEPLRPFFRDVVDHLTSAAENIDTLEQLLSSAFEAHLAQIQLQQNDDMRKISAAAALVVVPTFIAGVYGMNFSHMPELGWTFGYPFALVLMAVVVLLLWLWFRRSGWL